MNRRDAGNRWSVDVVEEGGRYRVSAATVWRSDAGYARASASDRDGVSYVAAVTDHDGTCVVDVAARPTQCASKTTRAT